MIAQVAGVLTIILAVWAGRSEKRRWMRFLAFSALGTVIAQGVLGGLTVLYFLPPLVSSAHAMLAQTFFCLAVAMAIFTGRKWVEIEEKLEIEGKLGQKLGQRFLVDNVPGPGGTAAARAALQAHADGYTITLFTSSTAIRLNSPGRPTMRTAIQ